MGVPKTADGKPIVSVYPTSGTRVTIVTHNWADKTTWYPNATRVVNGTCSAVVTGTIYSMGYTNIVDVYHGKIWDEDRLLDANGNSYRVSVEVNTGSGWVAKTENDPHDGSGHYTVNYATGTITFDSTVGLFAQVRATFHYAGNSEFTIAPIAGKVLRVKTVEAQFSDDIVLNDTVDFVAYGYVDVFAPQLVGNPYASGTKIPIATTRYKTMYDFQAESNGALPTIPAIGGIGNWRGIQNKIIVFPWSYVATMDLSSAAGMEIRIKLQHDVPFGGEFSNATLYCLSEDET